MVKSAIWSLNGPAPTTYERSYCAAKRSGVTARDKPEQDGSRVMRLRLAQYGTGHGHAAGKLMAMQANNDVEVAGVFEPDASRRSVLDKPGSPYHGVRWYSSEQELLGDAKHRWNCLGRAQRREPRADVIDRARW